MSIQKINSMLKVSAFLFNVEGEAPLLRISQEAKMNYKIVRNARAIGHARKFLEIVGEI